MKGHIMSILRANGLMEREDLLFLSISTLRDVPVCKADADQALTEMVIDGTVEVHDYSAPYGVTDRYYALAHCGHDQPMECNAMGCQIKNPGND